MTVEDLKNELIKLILKEIPTGDYMKGYFDALKDVLEDLKEIE